MDLKFFNLSNLCVVSFSKWKQLEMEFFIFRYVYNCLVLLLDNNVVENVISPMGKFKFDNGVLSLMESF